MSTANALPKCARLTGPPKITYATEREALDAKKAAQRHPGCAGKLRAYECPKCGGWHLTKWVR